ncbi:hypothetical protein K2173_004537 [Erythroxylum novogranatense]|uniref:cAMP-regulated phosphoprotein 19-related protein n=1 Tax=Erythroxylum novogranatense TaxID=1862640 RepID=A0AAV8T597_9ROSI|nr:hypothetical protein K2173_004537 [Erythroxylum novogranatense]
MRALRHVIVTDVKSNVYTRSRAPSFFDKKPKSLLLFSRLRGMEDVKEQEQVDGGAPEHRVSMPSSQDEEASIKKKYGGIMPKKPPLISKDHERAYFDSADWALGKQGVEKPKGPLEALRPKLQPTQQQTRYRKSPYAPSDGEDGGTAPLADTSMNE